MIFHENRLLADDAHEISYLIFSKIKEDVAKFVVSDSAAVVIGPFRVKPNTSLICLLDLILYVPASIFSHVVM